MEAVRRNIRLHDFRASLGFVRHIQLKGFSSDVLGKREHHGSWSVIRSISPWPNERTTRRPLKLLHLGDQFPTRDPAEEDQEQHDQGEKGVDGPKNDVPSKIQSNWPPLRCASKWTDEGIRSVCPLRLRAPACLRASARKLRRVASKKVRKRPRSRCALASV